MPYLRKRNTICLYILYYGFEKTSIQCTTGASKHGHKLKLLSKPAAYQFLWWLYHFSFT